jgi:hypothetical protein
MKRHLVRFVGLLVTGFARVLPYLVCWVIGKLS